MKKTKSFIASVLIVALTTSSIYTQYGLRTALAQSYMRSAENTQNKASESNTTHKVIIASTSNLLNADEVDLEDSAYHYQETVNGVTITIDAEVGVIPKKAITVITPIEKKMTDNQLVAFDIQFMLDGEEIQPKSQVKVSFSMEDLPDNAQVFHISDNDQEETVASSQDSEESITFMADHFSVYGISLTAMSDDPLGNPLPGGTEDGEWKGNYVYYGACYTKEEMSEHFYALEPLEDTLGVDLFSMYTWNGERYLGASHREPIKWRILKNDGNRLLLLSDKLLGNSEWYELNSEMREVEWEDSLIRKRLIDSASTWFLEEERSKLREVSVQNSASNSKEKIFLPSKEELSNTAYGFPEGGKCKARQADYACPEDQEWNTWNETSYWLRSKDPANSSGTSWLPYYVTSDGVIGKYAYTYIYGMRPMIQLSVDNELIYTSLDDEMRSYGLHFNCEEQKLSVGDHFDLVLESSGAKFDLSKAEWGSTDETVVTVNEQGRVTVTVPENEIGPYEEKHAYVYAHIGQHFAGCLITVTNIEKSIIAYPQVGFGETERNLRVHFMENSDDEGIWDEKIITTYDMPDDGAIIIKNITNYNENYRIRTFRCSDENDTDFEEIFDEKLSLYRDGYGIAGGESNTFRLADIWLDDEKTYLMQVSTYENGFDSPIIYEQWFFITPEHRGFSGRNNGWCLVNQKESFGYDENYKIPKERYFDVFGISLTSLVALGGVNWGGNCFGLSLLAVANYNETIDLKTYFGAESITNSDLYSYGYNEVKDYKGCYYYSIEKNKKLIELIERTQISQTTPTIRNCEVFKDDTQDGYYSELLSYLDKSNPYPLLISLSYTSLIGDHSYVGHTMVVNTSIKPEDLDNGWYRLCLYDSNYPGFTAGLTNPINGYTNEPSYLKINVNTGEWEFYACENTIEYFKEGCGNINEKKSKSIWFFDVSKLDEKFFVDTLEYDKSIRSSYIQGSSFSVCAGAGTVLAKVVDNELVYCSDDVEFIPYCQGESSEFCGYFNIDDPMYLIVADSECMFINYDANYMSHGNIQSGNVLIDTNSGTITAKNTNKSTICLQNNETLQAVMFEDNLSEGDNVLVTLSNDSNLTLKTNKTTLNQLKIENKNNIVDLSSSSIKESHNTTVNGIKLFTDDDSENIGEYTVNYELNGGVNHHLNPTKYRTGTAITLQKPSKEGYTFKGWYTTSNFKDGTVIEVITKEMSENINVYAKWEKNTSGSGSGGSGSGGGGGSRGGGGGRSSSAGGSTSGGPGNSLPSYVEKGEWSILNGFWRFTDAFGNLKVNTWTAAYNPYATAGQQNYDWFRFDVNGNMVTGWFTDIDGNRYFLNPISDGTLGKMMTGWVWIADESGVQRCYYFNPNSDGYRGKLLINTVVDGYTVDANGCWTINGVVQVK